MSSTRNWSRRKMLRGMMGGAAIGVGVPLLDCFLNTNGTALADGSAMPVRFCNWFAGLGFNPGRWEPKIVGAKYEMAPELQVLNRFKDRFNIYSGMKVFLDGKNQGPHLTGYQVCLGGGIPLGTDAFPTIDTLIADTIGTHTRFRSLEAACEGTRQSYSSRGGTVYNPSEVSPATLYARIFGPEFKDPNSAEFTPDPFALARRSALSAVAEERQRLSADVGTADRARLDEYFTSLRQLEQQLDIELQRPAPLAACTMAAKADDAPVGTVVDDALTNHKLFAGLLAHAFACGQTRVANLMFSSAASPLRKAGSTSTFHMVSHEEPVDPALGYQPTASWFMVQVATALNDLLTVFDGIREGDGTLLDHSLIYYSSDSGFAKFHSLDNMPLFTAGGAGGRIKTGIHVQAKGETVTRVGLTIQQALGVPLNSWGTDSNRTSKTITEVLA